jgi:hypothetical protein
MTTMITIKSETLISREKAKAILAHVGQVNDFHRLDGCDFYLVTDEDGDEHLWVWGDDDPIATADSGDTSWYSSGYPALPSTYCVCGQEPEGPWEAVENGLESFEAGETWLRANFTRFPEYVAWYVDREDNDGHAESYWSVRGGELVHTN